MPKILIEILKKCRNVIFFVSTYTHAMFSYLEISMNRECNSGKKYSVYYYGQHHVKLKLISGESKTTYLIVTSVKVQVSQC